MQKLTCFVLCTLVGFSGLTAQQSAGRAFAGQPAVLTAAGQSADFEMVRVLMTRAKLSFRTEALITADKLSANDKTLVLVIGGSSKGLGAAGVSAEAELDRIKALVKKARDLGLKIIALHVGGEARRGTLSDMFVSYCVPVADFVIVVADGDKDRLFTNLTRDAKIFLKTVDKISAAGAPLADAFVK